VVMGVQPLFFSVPSDDLELMACGDLGSQPGYFAETQVGPASHRQVDVAVRPPTRIWVHELGEVEALEQQRVDPGLVPGADEARGRPSDGRVPGGRYQARPV